MANKKKGHLTVASEWARHLRKYMKNQFWRGERNASKKLICNEVCEADNLLWQFEELIKTLIAMTLPLEEQVNFYGIGATADEMLIDFDTYFTLNKLEFIERGVINDESKRLLDDIDSLTDRWSSEKEESFWFEMEKHQNEWDILREKAKAALTKMNKSNFTVDVTHKNEFDRERNLVVQTTKVKLKEK
jgi:hypothetical protein